MEEEWGPNDGMTYRQWLAGQIVGHLTVEIMTTDPDDMSRVCDNIAGAAVALADAVIARLSR